MKRIFLLLNLIFSLPLFALYNGNPSQPDMPELGLWISSDDWWGFKMGYQWDDTFEKRVKVEDPQTTASSIKTKDLFDKYQAYKNFGVFTFNVIDRFEIYGELGTMKATLSARPLRTTRIQFETDSYLAWGVGGRIVLLYWEEMIMGVSALYNGSFLHLDRLIQNGTARRPKGARLSYHEWQVGVSFSREIGICIPYIGLAYASMRSCLKHLPSDPTFSFNLKDETLKNREPFIFFLGIGLTNGRIFALNLETRMVAEKAISLSADLRF